MAPMTIQIAPVNEIKDELCNVELVETHNHQIPLVGRIMIGYDPGEPEDPDPQNWKSVILDIGLENTGDDKNYEWYWEISIRNISSTEFVSKRHNTGFQAQYKPSCSGCYCVPMEIRGQTMEDVSQHIIGDITKNFRLDTN